MRSSPSSLSLSSLLPFLSKHHHKVSHHWRSYNIPIKFKIHIAATSSTALPHKPSTPYHSVQIQCPKDNAVITLLFSFFLPLLLLLKFLTLTFLCALKDMLGEALLCFGATSVSVDHNDGCQTIDEICITSIYPEGEDINLNISHAFDSIGFKEKPRYEIKAIEEEDWIKRSQESFHPVEVTKGLWVVPEWSTPPLHYFTAVMDCYWVSLNPNNFLWDSIMVSGAGVIVKAHMSIDLSFSPPPKLLKPLDAGLRTSVPAQKHTSVTSLIAAGIDGISAVIWFQSTIWV
ncbi:hypothetical protein RYX36_023476 [Vicia faba]